MNKYVEINIHLDKGLNEDRWNKFLEIYMEST